jgi:type IV secretory pathway VirB3-like protein
VIQSASDDLRTSAYPRALVIEATLFGVPAVWWGIVIGVTVLLVLVDVLWYFVIPIVVLIYASGLIATRWELKHIDIYRQYSRQRDAYEPGFFIRQRFFKRPETMGRDYLG